MKRLQSRGILHAFDIVQVGQTYLDFRLFLIMVQVQYFSSYGWVFLDQLLLQRLVLYLADKRPFMVEFRFFYCLGQYDIILQDYTQYLQFFRSRIIRLVQVWVDAFLSLNFQDFIMVPTALLGRMINIVPQIWVDAFLRLNFWDFIVVSTTFLGRMIKIVLVVTLITTLVIFLGHHRGLGVDLGIVSHFFSSITLGSVVDLRSHLRSILESSQP